MKLLRVNRKAIAFIMILGGIFTAILLTSMQPAVDFNTEVKPIFNKKCITCHGGVKRQADFSLLFRTDALAKNKSGRPAIIPGDPDNSEMIKRIVSKDPEERMPYKHEPLSDAEISTLRKWIKQGAHWGDHWAYVKVQPVEVPKPSPRFFGWLAADSVPWVKNNIDWFIYDKLAREKISPAPQADKAVLLRRVSMDLTGLPPDSSLASKFLSTGDDHAYEKLVDYLLASPHFGERWTSVWLDLARYADTRGYEKDGERNIWKYRDWVIDAFNQDKPYDVFLTEQIAGDLLPAHTDAQLIATAFQRNTMTNDEGGTNNEEFRTAAVLDRVNTTWQGLMGTTFACVQCHSHPYDPFTHDEYYKFAAFFNDARDEDTYGDYPILREYDKEDSEKLVKVSDWLTKNTSPEKANEELVFLKTWQVSINSIQAENMVNAALADTKYLTFRNHASAVIRHADLDRKDRLLYRYNAGVTGGIWTIHLDSADGPILKTVQVTHTKSSWRIASIDFPEGKGVHDLFMDYTNPTLKSVTADGMQFDWFHITRHLPDPKDTDDRQIQQWYWELLQKDLPGTPVMMENLAWLHRKSFVFERGNWLVHGTEVQADVPHSLNPFPKHGRHDRLGLARWLTDQNNPLTARTMVNRLWEQLFGAGIVETLEDMGTQGATPSNKDLLDYLSYRFMHEDKWSVKKLLKEIVLSATYRQESKVSDALLERDPYNTLYARGPRVRLSAEQIRDQALSISSLLSAKMFGPSVMPWQPDGIWHSPYNSQTWVKSDGQDQYRRSLYTYWKRTAPYPSAITFDGTSREVCTARRILSNTPLQALVTLNDSVYLEASRYFAYRMMDRSGNTQNIEAVIGTGYQLATFKKIPSEKLSVLKHLYDVAFEKYQKDPERSCEMIGVQDNHNNPATAAFVVVAGALLNLDEVITKN